LVQAFDNMVQQEQEISDASKNILDISCGGKVSNYQDNVDKNMRKLMLSGRGLYLHSNIAHYVEEKDFDWGSTPTMLGANREAIPGAALYGTLMAFALANQNRAFDGKPLNQVAMRALVSGNYEALATMKPYDSLVKPLQDAMAKAFVKEGGDSTEQGEKERREFEYWERRMLESGLERMQRELLQQQKLHDAWAIEMGRMLEGASILIMSEHEKLPLESKYLGNTFSGVSFFMQADVKLICNKQAVVERGIGAAPESEAYRQAQQAMNDLAMAASTEDYSMLMDASDKADIEYRREIDSAKVFSATKNRILTHMSEFAEPFIEELNQKAREATFTLRFAHGNEYISLTGNEMRFWITAVALADQRGMNSEELRQFICGEKTDLPDDFRQELQTMMDETDMDKKRTAFNTAMKRLDRELTAQKDLTTPYSRLLGDISALADPTFFRRTTMMLLYSNHMARLDRRTGKEITVALEPGGRMGSLLHEISSLSTPTDTSNTMREIESSNEPYASGSVKYHLEKLLLGKLAESYMNKVNGMQTSEERLSFLMKNEYAIKGLFQTAREFVSTNAQKYSEDLALFKNAMRGGVITDFNKYMHSMTKQAAPANEKVLPENNAEMVKEQPKTGPNL
jgi:hypothetical protein